MKELLFPFSDNVRNKFPMKRFYFYLIFTFIMLGQTMSLATTAAAKNLILETTKGQIEIEMKPDLAPHHVARITELVQQGFYDGIIFHRVIPGFMAQTGDPNGTGTGGSGQKLDAEFSNYQYIIGTVGMARTMNPNSADSQFFICFEGCGHLTGQYTVWGQVLNGMGAVLALNAGEPPAHPDKIISAKIAN